MRVIFKFIYGSCILFPAMTQGATSACDVSLNGFPTCAIIHNSLVKSDQKIMLGVNQAGNLNTPDNAGLVETNSLNQTMMSDGYTKISGANGGSIGISYLWEGAQKKDSNGNLLYYYKDSSGNVVRDSKKRTITTTSSIGTYPLNYPKGWYDSTSQGSKWESWSAGAYDNTNSQAWASISQQIGQASQDPKQNQNSLRPPVVVKSFVVDSTSVKSTVWIYDTSGLPMLEVTHLYGPTVNDPKRISDKNYVKPNDYLFQALVTITNISGGTLNDVRYRRSMDWDIVENMTGAYVDAVGVSNSYNGMYYPKIASKNYTKSPPTKFDGYCDNGGEDNVHANPFLDCHPVNTSSLNTDSKALVGQIGSSFNFQFGELKCNESATFYIYYGAGDSSSKSKENLSSAMANSVGATVYSMGYDSKYDTLAYAFGFKGVSGTAVAPALPTKVASLPGGSSTDPSVFQTYAPPVLSNGKIYQALFLYQKDKQWIGEIKSYDLDSSGSFKDIKPTLASDKLKKLASDEGRSIWSVGYDPRCMQGMSGLKDEDIHNFTNNNLASIEKLLFNCPTSDMLADSIRIIDFIHGKNSFKEESIPSDAIRSSVLGDTYHSEMIVVPPPNAPWTTQSDLKHTEASFRGDNKYQVFAEQPKVASRPTMIYVGANDGMLHAFDLDLNEKWAFIPPPVLPMLRHMAGDMGNADVGGGKSNSIFTVDGPIAVKDVYFYGEDTWKTVLIGGLGWGGNAYYAIDVTYPQYPKHLFSFSNDTNNKEINYWDATGNKSTFPYADKCSFDYSKLGGTWSRPVIMLLPYSVGAQKQRWVAVFGGGYAGGASVTGSSTTSSFGAYAYAIDFEPDNKITTKNCGATDANSVSSTGGHVLYAIPLDPDSASNIPNGVTAHLSVVTGDGTKLAKYYGGKAYFTDLQGQLWKWNLSKNELSDSNPATDPIPERLFIAQANLANDRLAYNQLATTIVSEPQLNVTTSRLYNYFGTGDLTRIQRRSGTINNRIYGVSDDKFTDDSISNVTKTVASPTKFNQLDLGENCTVSNSWFANISPSSSYPSSANFQKIIGRAAVFNKFVYFTAYEPESADCPIYGRSKIIEVGNQCKVSGSGAVVGDGLATQPVIDNKGNIYIGVSNMPKGSTLKNGVDNISKLKSTAINNSNRIQYKSWREKRAY